MKKKSNRGKKIGEKKHIISFLSYQFNEIFSSSRERDQLFYVLISVSCLFIFHLCLFLWATIFARENCVVAARAATATTALSPSASYICAHLFFHRYLPIPDVSRFKHHILFYVVRDGGDNGSGGGGAGCMTLLQLSTMNRSNFILWLM